MKNFKNLAIVAAVVVAAGLVFALKHNQVKPSEPAPAAVAESASAPTPLPRLLELGADKCTACKQMAPILADLKAAYAGQLAVDFIDVWQNADAAKPYGVRIIPLQIFFDAEGRELFRHVGFFAKETTKKASNGLFLRSRLTSLSSFSLMRNTKASSLRASTIVSMRRLRK